MTVVQDAGRPLAGLSADDGAPRRAPAHAAEPMPEVVLRGARARRAGRRLRALRARRRPARTSAPAKRVSTTRRPASDPLLPPAVFTSVQHLLARQLGPVASVLVKRAVDTAGGSRPAFVLSLLAELPAPRQAAFRAELEALLTAPQRSELGR